MTSHELRGPVCTMLGLVNLLELDTTTAQMKEDIVAKIRQTAEEMDRVTRETNAILTEDGFEIGETIMVKDTK